ncbi:MAG: LIC12162 family protein [Clostridia bacterium]
MFLITTADQRFWKTDEPILFLGEWCKIYNQRDIWSRLNYSVLPYHWNDREKLYQDYLYLDTIYEKYLPFLTERLNALHNVNYSLRYWRIVAGFWLYQFIEIVFDRYLSIKQATDSGLVSETWICPHDRERWAPSDFSDALQWFFSDEYNNYLYSRIIQNLGEIPFRILERDPSLVSDNSLKPNKPHFHDFIKNRLGSFNKYFPSRWNQVVFDITYLDKWDSIHLQLSLGQIPYFEFHPALPECDPFDSSMREKLIFRSATNEFESILDWMIAEHIPRVYVEGYSDLHIKSLDTFPKRPKVIFTANAYNGHTLFQLWSAFHVEHGAKLIGTQHGGHYGSGLWSASESHEIRICDRFYTTGWETDAPNIHPLSTGIFNGAIKRVSPDPEGTILMVSTSLPRYSYWMYSVPVGPQMLDYINDQYRFVRSVSEEAHEDLLLRLYPLDYGWNEASRWRDVYPEIKLYQGRKSIYQQLNESRLFIGTYNATTYLETFAADYPTILFWNPDQWELRPSAKPFFEKLRAQGILHDTPESAAEKVNEIYKDPQTWWNRTEIRKAVSDFKYHFLRTSDNWLEEWKHEFQDIVKEYDSVKLSR